MAVRPGYKQTEAGIIPIDWSEYTVGDLIEFVGGSQPDKSVFTSSWKPGYIRLIQIRDYKTDKYETYVPTHLARRFCDEADIMIGRYGPPVFQILRGLSGAYNVALIKAIPKSQIDQVYAYYFLKQEKLFEFIDKLSQRSSGQTGVDLGELRQYPLALPPLREQQAIAEALSDVDGLISALDGLIAKKRALKQGAMQELLTGQRRLPGFVGEWELRTLDSLGRRGRPAIKAGPFGSSLTKDKYVTEGYKIYGQEQVIRGDYLYGDYFIPKALFEELKSCAVEAGDILLSLVGTAGRVLVIPDDAPVGIINPRLIRFSFDQSVIASHFFQYLFETETYQTLLERSAQGGTMGVLNASLLRPITIPVPPLTEQTAIAQILADMDAEIAALVQKREKTVALKQGMMQRLLTGEVRLGATG